MKDYKAHDYPNIYQDLGYDLSELGCIMLELDGSSLEKAVSHAISDSDTYYANDKKRHWIKGIVANKPHVTLLYGLLRPGIEWKEYVDQLLFAEIPSTVETYSIGYFDSPYDDEPYYCIVAHLTISAALQRCNEKLKFLPHINTFPGYKAHVTLGYIKKDERRRDEIIRDLTAAMRGKSLKSLGIDYGNSRMKGRDVKRTFFLTKEQVKELNTDDGYITANMPHYELMDGTILYTKAGAPAGVEHWTSEMGVPHE